jgi:hypothetical protein
MDPDARDGVSCAAIHTEGHDAPIGFCHIVGIAGDDSCNRRKMNGSVCLSCRE